MTWGNRYKLPWIGLDEAQIDAAAAEVLRRWPTIKLERGPRSADRVTLYFQVPADVARELETYGGLYRGNSVDEHWAFYDYDGSYPIPIEVEFCYFAADPAHELDAWSDVSFDSGSSGNSLAPGTAVEITDVIGKFLGVECEP